MKNRQVFVSSCFSCAILVISLAIISFAEIPDYIHICRANDPNLAQCINNSVNHLRPILKKGIPELDVPPIEPLRLNEIRLKRGPSGAAINCNISNVQVWGPASFVVTELKPNLKKNKFYFKIWLPHLYFTGDYVLDMRILLLNIKGQGLIHGNFTDYKSEVIMKGTKVVRNGEEYLKFDRLRLTLEIGKSSIHLNNLFENDRILREASDDILNENSELFVQEIQPALEDSLADTFTEIANKLTEKFTYKELFP